MRKFTLLFSMFLVFLGVTAQTNLVQNPGFETWTEGLPAPWYIVSSSVTGVTPAENTAVFSEGTKSIKIDATSASGTFNMAQAVVIEPGKEYTLSAKYFIVSGDGTDARIWCNFKKDATTFFSDAELIATGEYTKLRSGNANSSGSVYLTDVKGSWQTYTVTFTAPTTATGFDFQFRTYRGSVVNWDNFSLVEAGGTPVSSTPTISPATGNITGPTAVTITAAEGASIYYTTNGSEPTNASTVYTAPFNVSTTTTVKAIAYETGKNPSSVATATYTLVTANTVANIAALRAITLPSTEIYKLTGEVVLTLKTSTRNAKYIQDATGAILVDDASGKITSNYNLGDGITGITGTLALYQNMLQFTPTGDPGAATSTGKTITPLSVNLADITSDHQAKLVKVSGLTISDIDGGTGVFVASKSYNLNGASNPIIRTQYADLDYIGTTIPTAPQNIVGVVLMYNSTVQLVPRSLAEISTGVSKTRLQDLSVWTAAGKINFNAAAGEMVEVYNTLGQRLYNAAATAGQNEVPVAVRGVAIVKVGNRVGKVIL